MENTKILEMLENGEIENLKKLLRDEIFVHSISKKSGTKERYVAMKKYFSYIKSVNECYQKPCIVNINGEKYTSFTNGYSITLTKEDTGQIMLFENPERYLKVASFIKYDGIGIEIDLNTILAKAKSRGYKLKKSEVKEKFKYLLHYDGAYYKVGLLDINYSIINDNNKAIIYHKKSDKLAPIIIKNDIGICVVSPIKCNENDKQNNKIVIEVEGDK